MTRRQRTRRPSLRHLLAPLLVLVFTVPLQARAAAAQPAVDPEEEAPRIYARDCASCHGTTGQGTNRGPSLVGVGRASIDYYLSTGRMPIPDGAPWLPLTSDAQPDIEDRTAIPTRGDPRYPPPVIRALVDHVALLTGGGGPDIPDVRTDPALLGEGGRLYRLYCAACHAWSGGGGPLYRRLAPSLQPSTPTQAAEAMLIGPGEMPEFSSELLTEEEVNAIVSYVDFLDDRPAPGGFPIWYLGSVGEGLVAAVVGLGALVLVALVITGRSPRRRSEVGS